MYYDEAANVYLDLISKYSISEILVNYNKNQELILSKSRNEILKDLVCKISLKQCEILDELIFLFAVDYNTPQFELKKYVMDNKKPLNTKFRDKIEIYYTYKSIDRDRKNAKDISILFENLLFFKKNFLNGKNIVLENYYFHDYVEQLSIAFIPYPIIKMEEVETKDGVTFTEKNILTEEDEIFLENCSNCAGQEHIDILFSPEIHGSKEINKKLKYLAYKKHIPLIVGPSYHINKLNKSDCFIEENNHIKSFTIHKLYPAQVSSKDGFKQEGILSPIPFIFNIIHINGIGKIGFFICRDFVTDINGLIEHLDLDIILVQCYSENTSPFLTYLREHSSKRRIVILGNSCSALKNNQEKNFIQYGKHISKKSHGLNDENNKIINIKCNKGGEQCKSGRCYKVFKISIFKNEMLIEEKE